MNPAPVMTLPNARFKTFVTLNCSVKPTALMASRDAVTKPKPTAETKTCMSPSVLRRAIAGSCGLGSTAGRGLDLGRGQERRHRPAALHVALDRKPLS